MTRLPILHSPRLCRRGGDVCGDYVDDGRGGCRYFATTVATDAEGDFAVPACALAMADEGPMADRDIGRVFGVTGREAGYLAAKAEARLEKRARLMRLWEALDIDAYAGKRAPAVAEDEADDAVPAPTFRPGALALRILAAMSRGASSLHVIAAMSEADHHAVGRILSKLAGRGLVRRRSRGVWSPVQYAAKESA